MSIDPNNFKKALSTFASGVTIVTYKNNQEDSGITVSAFSSVSLEPPLILVSISTNSPAVKSIQDSRLFSVNILDSRQVDVSNTFAKQDDSRIQFLKAHSSNRGMNGILHIPQSLASLDCELYADYEGGDHRIFVGRVQGVEFSQGEPNPQPLLYYNKNYRTIKDL